MSLKREFSSHLDSRQGKGHASLSQCAQKESGPRNGSEQSTRVSVSATASYFENQRTMRFSLPSSQIRADPTDGRFSNVPGNPYTPNQSAPTAENDDVFWPRQ